MTSGDKKSSPQTDGKLTLPKACRCDEKYARIAELAWALCAAVSTSYQEEAIGKFNERIALEQELERCGFKKPPNRGRSIFVAR